MLKILLCCRYGGGAAPAAEPDQAECQWLHSSEQAGFEELLQDAMA